MEENIKGTYSSVWTKQLRSDVHKWLGFILRVWVTESEMGKGYHNRKHRNIQIQQGICYIQIWSDLNVLRGDKYTSLVGSYQLPSTRMHAGRMRVEKRRSRQLEPSWNLNVLRELWRIQRGTSDISSKVSRYKCRKYIYYCSEVPGQDTKTGTE